MSKLARFKIVRKMDDGKMEIESFETGKRYIVPQAKHDLVVDDSPIQSMMREWMDDIRKENENETNKDTK